MAQYESGGIKYYNWNNSGSNSISNDSDLFDKNCSNRQITLYFKYIIFLYHVPISFREHKSAEIHMPFVNLCACCVFC